MAVMDALLRIKADVQGEGQVQRLGTALGGLNKTAAQVSGGFRGLAGAAGGLVTGLGALVPLASGAGLLAMAKNAIDAADNMNDLRQKTGASVESLSQFEQAAKKSGTTLDSVANAMVKLNRGIVDGKAASALREIGISATDATGKLKSTDQIMLEVAKVFQSMPDGAEKSALAIKLFGKSGADMIPMLNMGDKAIKSLAVTMTGEFAAGADEFNDRLVDLQTGITKLAVSLGTALLPALNVITNGLVAAISGFSALPGPIQTLIIGITGLTAAVVILAPALASIITIGTSLAGLGIGATIAGWAGAIGPAVAGITTALSGLLAWMTSTLLPGLVAFFSGPVGWTVLAVAAVVAMAIAFREPIGKFFTWLGGAIGDLIKSIPGWLAPIGKIFSSLWENILKTTNELLIKPWVNIFNNLLRKPISDMLSWLGNAIRAPFDAVVSYVRGAINALLRNIASGINAAIGAVNSLISAYNSLPTPDLPFVPTVSVPQFAQGGVVDRPTLAMVGEGGEREYIIPESKMAAASARYLSGSRGGSVLRPGPSMINITTGPVMQQGGQQWVTMADLIDAMRATEDSTLDRLRTFAGRRSAGII